MSRKTIPILACACALTLILTSCAMPGVGTQMLYLEERVYETGVLPDDCYLCGMNPDSPFTPYWGQANLGLLNMNTMDCRVLELNRYDADGTLIQTASRYGLSQGIWGDSEDGSLIGYMLSVNKGYLDLSVSINDASILNIENMKPYFCTDCLSGIINQYSYDEDHWDIAIVDLAARQIKPLQDGYTLAEHISDYRVSYHYNEASKKMSVTAFYCPDRYTEPGYDLNETVMEQIVNYCTEYGYNLTLNNEITGFIGRFTRINTISSTGESVCFEEWTNGYRKLYINKDGTYSIFEYT